MARIREALRQADMTRGRPADARPGAEKEARDAQEADLEIPFIEVGGPLSSFEASPSVLASVPARISPSFSPLAQARQPEQPVVDAPPALMTEAEMLDIPLKHLPAEKPAAGEIPGRFIPELVTFIGPMVRQTGLSAS